MGLAKRTAMARAFHLASEYEGLTNTIEASLNALLDRHDPNALAYVDLTGLGRVHVIVVSDRLCQLWGERREDVLWDELEAAVGQEPMAIISVFQLIDTAEAVRLHGPLDAERLLHLAETMLRPAWGELGPVDLTRVREPDSLIWRTQLESVSGLTENWALAYQQVARTEAVRALIVACRAVRTFLGSPSRTAPVGAADAERAAAIPDLVETCTEQLRSHGEGAGRRLTSRVRPRRQPLRFDTFRGWWYSVRDPRGR